VLIAALELDQLPDVLQVTGVAGLLLGAAISLFVRAWTTRQLLENLVLGAGVGGIVGGVVGFGLWAGAQVG
jgi:hypothetical protein